MSEKIVTRNAQRVTVEVVRDGDPSPSIFSCRFINCRASHALWRNREGSSLAQALGRTSDLEWDPRPSRPAARHAEHSVTFATSMLHAEWLLSDRGILPEGHQAALTEEHPLNPVNSSIRRGMVQRTLGAEKLKSFRASRIKQSDSQ